MRVGPDSTDLHSKSPFIVESGKTRQLVPRLSDGDATQGEGLPVGRASNHGFLCVCVGISEVHSLPLPLRIRVRSSFLPAAGSQMKVSHHIHAGAKRREAQKPPGNPESDNHGASAAPVRLQPGLRIN